ncbi:MAG: FAD-dependent oxidoreductase [Chloroflexi bacterium]|nr:MAG: FAD-dependent oxidoreductase [Chloroflexota bacterium]
MKNYAQYSFWLETAGDLTPRPPLDGSTTVDVAILGAGLSGLWTAYHLLKRDPSLKVAVVEAEIAGFGASGRNGGWCYSGFPLSPKHLIKDYGVEAARAVSLAMFDAVDDVGAVCAAEGIDAHYRKSGTFEIARAEHHLPVIHEYYEEVEAIGLEDHYELLDARQTAEHLRVNKAVGSFFIKEGATVQPARLTRGLAEAVERRGGVIYEQTRVTDVRPGPNPALVTERGDVTAKVVVLCGEAYLSQLPGRSRQIMPVTSHIVLTEPLKESTWEQIGWKERQVIGAYGTTGGYLNHTADGRIAFGPYRGGYPFRSRISDAINLREEIFEHGRRSALDWFPMLRGVRFTHRWGGVLGVPRDRMPTMTYDRRSGIAIGSGYSGEGVATTNLTGRVLTDLITETDSDLTRLPMASHAPRPWEPEPLRWIGFKAVRYSLGRVERNAEKTGKYPEKPTLAQRLWRS